MWAAIECARPGNRLGDIGYACQSIAESHNYGVVKEYVGHGIGKEMHEDPAVPNYGRANTGIKLTKGMALAIEPMINMGTYEVVDGLDGWLVNTADNLPSAHFEKSVVVWDDDPIILTREAEYLRPLN